MILKNFHVVRRFYHLIQGHWALMLIMPAVGRLVLERVVKDAFEIKSSLNDGFRSAFCLVKVDRMVKVVFRNQRMNYL